MRTPSTESTRMLAGSAGGINEQGEDNALLIGAKAAAMKLAVSTRTLWSLTKCNAVPHHRIGRALRYSPAELERWVSAGCPTAPDSAVKIRKSMRKGVA